jgi:hypothetical protein
MKFVRENFCGSAHRFETAALGAGRKRADDIAPTRDLGTIRAALSLCHNVLHAAAAIPRPRIKD